jgi:hypothetical protein
MEIVETRPHASIVRAAVGHCSLRPRAAGNQMTTGDDLYLESARVAGRRGGGARS